ncbi:MAG: phosphopantetheine-binding protein, partial [Cyclobacteriaceae bacterium]
PDPDFESLVSRGYVAPETETEQVLAGIWAELLGLDRVGIHDNFFELGGHSLLAVKLTAQIRDDLSTHVSIRKIFELSTVKYLAQYLDLIQLHRKLEEANTELDTFDL